MPLTKEEFLASDDAARMKKSLTLAAEYTTSPDTPGKAPVLGVNFRISVLDALQASWDTFKVATKFGVAIHAPFDPLTWLEIGVDGISAVRSFVSALVEQMEPIDYVTYVILAQTPDGIEASELKKSIEVFLKDSQTGNFSWHLGMSGERVERARERLLDENWFDDTIRSLTSNNMMKRSGTVLQYQSRNFTVGLEGR